MGIDSATKRASILGFGSGDLLPVPSGSIDAGGRLTLLWLYSGIAASALAQATGRLEYTFPFSLLEYTFPKSAEFTMDGFAEETLEQP